MRVVFVCEGCSIKGVLFRGLDYLISTVNFLCLLMSLSPYPEVHVSSDLIPIRLKGNLAMEIVHGTV